MIHLHHRSLLLLALGAALASTGCKKPEDPLDPFRKQCEELKAAGSLKAGMPIDDCAKTLQANAAEADPAHKAEELAARVESLVAQGADKPGDAQTALHVAEAQLTGIGAPAIPVLQTHMAAAKQPDAKLAYAQTLVGLCFDDCAKQKYDCIVPALLEGLAGDRPREVKLASIKGLMTCTGKDFGEDAAGWQSWWAGVKAAPAR